MTTTTTHPRYTITTYRHRPCDWSISVADAPWATTHWFHQPSLAACLQKAAALGVDDADLRAHVAAITAAPSATKELRP